MKQGVFVMLFKAPVEQWRKVFWKEAKRQEKRFLSFLLFLVVTAYVSLFVMVPWQRAQ